MEKKKQLLIKVLTKLKPYRNLAEGFLALIESEYCTNEIMDKLTLALQDAITSVKSAKEKSRFKKSLQAVKKIREQEEQEEKISDEELDKLLDTT